ncbi:MAG TPA: fatty acid desaturase [Deltaproteobacteria bacterium]|nr:fatty acid desaturase [Deltaproteobacteria bacterium]
MGEVEERRAGAALVRATKPFSVEDPATTRRLFTTTMLAYAGCEAVALFAPWWPLQIVGALTAGLVLVRIFIFFHDHLHGAIFRTSRLGHAAMVGVGWFMMSPHPVWRETHDYHHRNNAKMLGASIGSYPTVTVNMWRSMSPKNRFWYRFARNPLTIVFGYFTVFMAGMCLSAFVRDPRRHWRGPASMVLHFGLLAAIWAWLGPATALISVSLPLAFACAAGSYLFYAQHNFPSAELRSREHWTYHHAALRASSMFDMPGWMHWFTGNIGYHHVHHLNHQIPFYRLPEAMAAIPELQTPGRTSWRPADVLSCLRLKLWDPDRNQLVGWSEASA